MEGCEDCDEKETCNVCNDLYHTYEDDTCHRPTCLIENCSLCVDKYVYPVADQVCVTCEKGFYLDEDTNVCIACIDGCHVCSNTETCE